MTKDLSCVEMDLPALLKAALGMGYTVIREMRGEAKLFSETCRVEKAFVLSAPEGVIPSLLLVSYRYNAQNGGPADVGACPVWEYYRLSEASPLEALEDKVAFGDQIAITEVLARSLVA